MAEKKLRQTGLESLIQWIKNFQAKHSHPSTWIITWLPHLGRSRVKGVTRRCWCLRTRDTRILSSRYPYYEFSTCRIVFQSLTGIHKNLANNQRAWRDHSYPCEHQRDDPDEAQEDPLRPLPQWCACEPLQALLISVCRRRKQEPGHLTSQTVFPDTRCTWAVLREGLPTESGGIRSRWLAQKCGLGRMLFHYQRSRALDQRCLRNMSSFTMLTFYITWWDLN